MLQFVETLETNILAEIDALVNVTISKVVLGSVSVSNTVAFTGADSQAALAGQGALADVLQSGDVSSIFGSSFGTVAVSSVAKANATNPSEYPHTFVGWSATCLNTAHLWTPCDAQFVVLGVV